MTRLWEQDGVMYTDLEIGDTDPVSHVVGQVFTDGSEPVTRALRVSSQEFARFVQGLCPRFHREGLSIVARDARTGHIIGAQLNDDMGTGSLEESSLPAWAGPAVALLDELDRRYLGDKPAEPNRYAHFFIGAVLPEYRKKRVATQLLRLSLERAWAAGYEKATVEATGLVSQHVMRKAGFVPRVEIPYATFVYEGSLPFQGITDHPSILFMDKDLAR